MKKIDRRTFLSKSSLIGVTSIISASALPNFVFGAHIESSNLSNKKICKVKKEIYAASPKPGMAIITNMSYTGYKGMRREEIRSFMESSDWSQTVLRRISENNGRTWSDFEPLPIVTHNMGEFTQGGGASQSGTGPYDPTSGCQIKPVFQRIFHGNPQTALKNRRKFRTLWDHGFYQLSSDNGRTWGEAHLLKYEKGNDFDISNWGDMEYLEPNQMYIGNNIIVTKNGAVIIPASIPVPYWNEQDKELYKLLPTYKEGCVAGAMCFVGKWSKISTKYIWEKSNSIFLSKHISSRGLTELEISELKNGNILLIMRGSNAGLDINKSPGRKWFSVSRDGGYTWDEVKEMHYDTGEQFYSPASISKTIRSSKTGKLYWIGNICDVPPKGNYPRYPLQIVEIDEENISFVKDSLTVIDDRDPNIDSEHLQLSNFYILEDIKTKNIEVYLTRLGTKGGGDDRWSADSYKYTLIL